MFPLDLPVKYSQVLIKFGHPGNRYIGTQVDLGAWVPVSFTVLDRPSLKVNKEKK